MTTRGERMLALVPGMAVRVGAAQLRNFLTGDEPFQMLAIGGVNLGAMQLAMVKATLDGLIRGTAPNASRPWWEVAATEGDSDSEQ